MANLAGTLFWQLNCLLQSMILSHFQTRQLTKQSNPSQISFSTDLGLSTTDIERIDHGWLLPQGQIITDQQVDQITQDENSCYQLSDGEIFKIEQFSELTQRYYSLMPTKQAPTMLISGIPMHRIKDTTPMDDTREKIKALRKPYGLILDTTTGLGYTAIQASQTAQNVITIEFDPAVLQICRLNPWSQALYDNKIIHQIIGDSFDVAKIFNDSSFDAIIHDPPMFNLAGHLYSQDIYYAFYRILKPNGHIFHYIGNPDSRTGAIVGRGVVERLKQAGFSIMPKPKAFGVLARKY